MSLKTELAAAYERAALESDPPAPAPDVSDGSYIERLAHYQTEAIIQFLENCEFRITQLNAPMVLETLKTPEQPVNVEMDTLLGEYAPILKTLKQIASPLGLGPVIDSLEGEIKKAIEPVLEGGSTLQPLDISKGSGGLESTGYVFIGEPPDSQSDFNVDDEDGQKTFTTVKFFRDDNESLI